jgi:ZIP family zinc transporter
MMQSAQLVLLVSLSTFVSTMAGGLLALRLKHRLHLVLGFSAGAVVGVALFDLLPESLSLAQARFGIPAATAALAIGFLGYLVLNRVLLLHGSGTPADPSSRRAALGAGSLCVHSFIDGLSIGLAFKVSMPVGAAVAVAVLVHDFSDGINTVGLVLRNEGGGRSALRWLLADALAPLAGAAMTLLITPSDPVLGICLAVFAGFFLYIGASDLVPESYRGYPRVWTTVMTLLGAAVIYIGVRLAQG